MEGEITVSSSQIAYCAQTVWLQNRNIQQIITGSLQNIGIDIQWFEKVLHACILDEDVQELPDGDQTLIGSKGATLSGGQKQRLALARAIYARESILMLDDVLSALDARTEHKVVDRLLSRNGLLRQLGSTVVLVTHASESDEIQRKCLNKTNEI